MSSRHLSERRSRPAAYWSEARAHLEGVDGVLARLIAAAGDAVLEPRRDPFYSLARSIVGQQISVLAAESVWRKLTARLGAVAPAALAVADEEGLRSCGLSRQKSRYLLSLAGHFADGALDIEAWPELDDEAVIERLTRVKGVGRWTAEMFLIFHLLRPDVLPVADLGLQRALRNHYTGGTRPTAEQMAAIAEPWRPWRSVAVWYLWRSLDAVPVEY